MLEIKNFSKTYTSGKKAVDNLSLTIEDGDIYGFIGHNGAGKTTTLNACAGILDFTEGEILINGVSIKTEPLEVKKQIAYLPDEPLLYEFMTGTAYLNFIADVYGISTEERQERIKKYSAVFEIESALGSVISSYSHGMKQKLAIISALIHKPKLFILDEPFVGLDPKATHIFKELMREMCKDGVSIFFSTHVLEVAQNLCNKIAIIKNGKLIKSGLTKELIKDKSLEDIFLELESV